jgi:hypothetical protein
MGVTAALARYAARSPRVLIVEVRGSWELRASLERRLLHRGWRLCDNPAGADVLAVCGEPGSGLAEAIDGVWDQLPGPRIRFAVVGYDTGDAAIDGALDRVCADLVDVQRHRDDARSRALSPHVTVDHQGMDMSTDRGDAHHGDMEMGGDMDMGGDMNMEMGGMDMTMDMSPSGIALAENGCDRDGLDMDVLHVHLGPVLRYWPAGLVVRCSLQGDVVVEATAWIIDADRVPAQVHGARVEAARECDRLVSLLAVAGWPRAATRARRIRELLLYTDDPALDAVDGLRRLVMRSRIFRWSMRGVTDAHIGMLDRARALLADAGSADDAPRTSIDALPGLIVGRDLATARLVIAGVDIAAAPTAEHAAHDHV